MKKGLSIIQMTGAVLLLVGAMLQITRWELAPFLYTVGAVLFAWIQVAISTSIVRYTVLWCLFVCAHAHVRSTNHFALCSQK